MDKFCKNPAYKSISSSQSKNVKYTYKVACSNGVCKIITL